MAISCLVDLGVEACISLHKYAQKIDPEKIRASKIKQHISTGGDLITGIVLLLLGIFAAQGMLSFTCASTWALVGAGATYTMLMAMKILEDLVKKPQNPPPGNAVRTPDPANNAPAAT